MNGRITIAFPAGALVKARPSKAQLLDSAAAWLALAQTQIGSLGYWMSREDRTEEACKSLDVLSSQLEHVRRALAESAVAK